MKKLTFKNGDTMPILGLGTWKSKPGEVYSAVREAIKVGFRHIDCAFIYMNEKEIGQALADAFSEGDVKREDLWITSKLWNNSHAMDAVIPTLRKTLADLQLDYLDLYLVHWPFVFMDDKLNAESADDMIPLSELPLENTWRGMELAVESGLTRHIGVSNFSVKKLKDLISKVTVKPEMNQIELHPLLHQNEVLAFCKSEGIHVTAYSPLGSPDRSAGLKAENEPNLFEHPIIVGLAEKHDVSPAQIMIAWAMERGTAVIPKSVNAGRIAQNLQSTKIELSIEDMQKMAHADRHFRYVTGAFWAFKGSSNSVANLWDE
ncbi:MAG: aldo/keto reductase [Flavobacteriales bacterium]|nr:aldo/keto reductase [Flavobacteriales bacterium]